MVLSSFASAQYGSAAGSGNVGYGGKGTSVPSGDYGHQAQDSSASSSGSAPDGNSEVSFILYVITLFLIWPEGPTIITISE